jgi:heme/copper-type cytochrome/quinol oxidase subunit 2
MSKNKIVAIVIVAVVVVFAGISLLVKSPPSGGVSGTSGPGAKPPTQPSGPVTREAAPQNIVVPSQNSKNTPQNVAVPTTVSPANVAGTSNYRNFNVTAEGGKFTPDTVTVYLNDQIVLNITAVDRDYDFTQPDIGASIPIPKGTTKTIRTQATATGKFTFYCASCGGPAKGPLGYLIVAPK